MPLNFSCWLMPSYHVGIGVLNKETELEIIPRTKNEVKWNLYLKIKVWLENKKAGKQRIVSTVVK